MVQLPHQAPCQGICNFRIDKESKGLARHDSAPELRTHSPLLILLFSLTKLEAISHRFLCYCI